LSRQALVVSLQNKTSATGLTAFAGDWRLATAN